jgi:hypothetical protein
MDERKLTRDQFEAVLRRATELALGESDSGELTEDELLKIASEVGIAPRHVRVALAESRSGQLERSERSGGTLDRMFGPEVLVVSRVIAGKTRPLSVQIDRFLVGGRLLQPVRRSASYLQYRQAVDWISQVARIASATSRRYYVASAKSVEVYLDELEEGRTLIEFRVDPGTRSEAMTGAFLGGGAGGVGAGIGVGVGVALLAPIASAAAAGLLAGSTISSVIAFAVARKHRGKLTDVRAEVEGILDHLESGEVLEPPPPSWRQWVKRQFHGARRLIGELEQGETSRDWTDE